MTLACLSTWTFFPQKILIQILKYNLTGSQPAAEVTGQNLEPLLHEWLN